MRKPGFRGWALGIGLSLGSGLAAVGCSSDQDLTQIGSEDPSSSYGQLSVPLLTVGRSGSLYQLERARLLLDGPRFGVALDLSGPDDVFETSIESGRYEAFLADGWQLLRLDPTGPRPVRARLTSENPAPVDIFPNAVSQLVLRFEVSDGDVVPGDAGLLSVGIEVDEVGGGGGASCDDAGQCLGPLLEDALSSIGGAPTCLPATRAPSPIGDIEVCADSVCADGTPGCDVAGLAVSAVAQVLRSGVIPIEAAARLIEPLRLTVGVPDLLGAELCELTLEASVTAIETSLEAHDLDGSGLLSLGLGMATPGNVDIDVTRFAGPALCGLIADLAPQLAREQLDSAVVESVLDGLSDIASSLSCVRCESDECPISCRIAGDVTPPPPPPPPPPGLDPEQACFVLCDQQESFQLRTGCGELVPGTCLSQCLALPNILPSTCRDELSTWMACIIETNAWICDGSSPSLPEDVCAEETARALGGGC